MGDGGHVHRWVLVGIMVCDKENIGSAKSIQNNGGILENEVEVAITLTKVE